MKPYKFSVYELFENKKRYVVPLFQRPYVWERDTQWFPLMQDIIYKADQIQQRQNLSDVIGSHFLGAAVVKQIPTFGKQVPAQHIIDGQQRLTTLQVLLSAFRDFLRATGYEDYDTDLASLTVNRGMRQQADECYKVWPTIADRSAFIAILDTDSPQSLQHHVETESVGSIGLTDAYFFFYEQIDEYVRFGEIDDEIDSAEYAYDSEMAQTRIDALMEALQRHLEIVVIELEDSDDPQIIFETLNARGVPLLPSDLIRNFVFFEASGGGDDVDHLYKKYWQPFDDYEDGLASFWKEEARQGRLSRPRIDLFMFYYLTMKTGRDIKIPQLFQEFQRWWAQSKAAGMTVEDLLADMRAYSEVYRRFATSDQNSRLGVFIYRLDGVGTATVYPTLLYLYGPESPVVEADLDSIVTDLESFLVRRMLCSLTTQNYNRTFLSVLRDLRNADNIDRGVFQEILLGFESDASRWPTDEEFHQQWLYNPVYRRLANRRVRMVLEAIDLQMETSKQEKLLIDEKLTIEHLFPQTPDQRYWPELADPDVVNTMGNLTLLTTALNSSVSNGAFYRKRRAIARQSKLRMNAAFQDLSEKDEWTVKDIIQRADDLFSYACAIWPRPDVSSEAGVSLGHERALASLRALAAQYGIIDAFQTLVAGGIKNGLHPYIGTESVMFAPQQNKKHALFTVWATPKEDRCHVYVATQKFADFFPLIDQDMAQSILGAEGWREMYPRDAEMFADALTDLLNHSE